MQVVGTTSNELFCLRDKGFSPGRILTGTSVSGLDLLSGNQQWGQGTGHRELEGITQVVRKGRLTAFERMERAARSLGASGVIRARTSTTNISGYTCFTFDGTTVNSTSPTQSFFSSSACGATLHSLLDTGFQPAQLVMGNVVYALGDRNLQRRFSSHSGGEVKELSEILSTIRVLALERLRDEAFAVEANAVLDVRIHTHPIGRFALELLAVGSACWHPLLVADSPAQVITSHLSGEELWTLARMSLTPVQIVMSTSVQALGPVRRLEQSAGPGHPGEHVELTRRLSEVHERALEGLTREALECGAEQVIGHCMVERRIGPGLIEYIAVGTAVRTQEGMAPRSENLIPQAAVSERDTFRVTSLVQAAGESHDWERASDTEPRTGLVVVGLGLLFGFIIFVGSFFGGVGG